MPAILGDDLALGDGDGSCVDQYVEPRTCLLPIWRAESGRRFLVVDGARRPAKLWWLVIVAESDRRGLHLAERAYRASVVD